MKTFNKTLLALVATSAVSVGANAALFQNANGTGQPYVGVKVGKYNISATNYNNDNPTAFGIYGGYQFDPNWGLEAEYVGTNKETITQKSNSAITGKFKGETYGGYGTFTYDFPNTAIYGKGKLGFAQNNIKIDGNRNDAKESGLAGGVAVGYRFSPAVAVQAEYSVLPKVEHADSDLITIGAQTKF